MPRPSPIGLFLITLPLAACSSSSAVGGSTAGGGATSGPSTHACAGLSHLAGTVTEDALGATAGAPIPNAAIGSSPAIATVSRTDRAGLFEATVPCSNETYTLTAKKVGYEPRAIQALPSEPDVSLAFTLVRSLDYQFVTLTAVDYASQALVGDVTIAIVGAGDDGTFYTAADGTTSFPFPRAVLQRVSFAAAGYHTYVLDYWPARDEWTPVEGLGRAVATSAGLTVKLVPASLAQIPPECDSGETSCSIEEGGDRILHCVDGGWAQSGRCPASFPYCIHGTCHQNA